PDYALEHILGGFLTRHYLHILDLKTVRLFPKEMAYLLVTYAIELRAEMLYPLYALSLEEMGSKVTVRSIVAEEKEHLQEMYDALEKIPSGLQYASQVISFENELFDEWLSYLAISLA